MTKVMVIDDSALVRELTKKLIAAASDAWQVQTASDPAFALVRMRQAWPDVIVMDWPAPRSDGFAFLRQVFQERATTIVVCSSQLTPELSSELLDAGVASIVPRSALRVQEYFAEHGAELVQAVRMAVASPVPSRRRASVPTTVTPPKLSADAILPPMQFKSRVARTTSKLVAIGISTGGTQALEQMLPAVPKSAPGLIIVQHMPGAFTRTFADRLNGLCEIEVREAVQGDRILQGTALIAPGGRHVVVRRAGAGYQVHIVDGPPVSRHRPSADVLFRSVASAAGPNALGLIMTGMGDDGARGLKEMQAAGARTVAQSEESCVVFGMPKEAIKLGAASEIVSLEHLPQLIAGFSK